MNCQEFRAAIGADPRETSVDIAGHAADCADCAAWRDALRRMDAVMQRALAIDVDTGAVSVPRGAPQHAWRGWAMAAGVACVTLVAGLLWFAAPRTALAGDVVAHMSEEPQAWARTGVAADPVRVARVLARSGVHLRDDPGLVTYANSCWFRGHRVPHLVFQTGRGPVTVMVLTGEQVTTPVEFAEEGYRGIILPAARGAIAILARNSQPTREAAARLQAAIDYSGE